MRSVVERSKTRPLACGAVSVTGAIIVLLAHLVVCYPILLLAGPEGYVYFMSGEHGDAHNSPSERRSDLWGCCSWTQYTLSRRDGHIGRRRGWVRGMSSHRLRVLHLAQVSP